MSANHHDGDVSGEEPVVPLSARQREATILLDHCQSCAIEASSNTASLSSALQSLHRTLIHLRVPSSSLNESDLGHQNPRGASGETAQTQHTEFSNVSNYSKTVPNVPAEQGFLYNTANQLIHLERVIFSVDDEVEGNHSFHGIDYENDCKLYSDAMEIIAQVEEEYNASGDTRNTTDFNTAFDIYSFDSSCDDPERWVDRCLDMCGYATSLDAAVDCLRRIVHVSSSSSASESSFHTRAVKRGGERPGFAAAITSLRTVRRRFLHLPPSNWDEEISLFSIPEPYRNSISNLKDRSEFQRICHLFECIILPLEYQHQSQHTYHQQHLQHQNQAYTWRNINKDQSDQQLSEPLSSQAMSVLPTLVASACYAINLPLPSWATPKVSHGKLFHSAWKTALAGDLLHRCFTASLLCQDHADSSNSGPSTTDAKYPNATDQDESIVEQSSAISVVSSKYFQLLVQQLIEGTRSEIVVHQLYKCWKACGTGNADTSTTSLPDSSLPRSILCRCLQSTLASIQSKRAVAEFSRVMLRHCAKQELPLSEPSSLLSQQTRDKLDGECASCILPFLREVLLPPLSKDTGLADAIVKFIILTPPTSYHRQQGPTSRPYLMLHSVDRAIPLCLVQLLAEIDQDALSNVTTYEKDSVSDDDSEADYYQNVKAVTMHLFAVASVWCEDIFIGKTDALQQQYVTEFVLHSLKSKHLTQDDLQRGLSDDGTSLAAALVQGVTFRLDVSRSESIRVDGMRVAEAMAKLLGQQLRFDELHPPCEGDIDITEENTKTETRREKKKRAHVKPTVPVIVDPDAEYFTDDSDSSDSSSTSVSSADSQDSDVSFDSTSSWGEDSLVPYSMNDDEEDLRHVPRPRTLRDCLAYLLTSENEDLAHDKQHAALMELDTIIHSRPLDLMDVVSTLVRILLFLEDKFSLDQFAAKRWNSLMAVGVIMPLETCMILVGEMKGNISLGTRLEALSLLKCVAQELSGVGRNPQQRENFNCSDQKVTVSTRLQIALNLHDASDEGGKIAKVDLSAHASKTRRWRKPRTFPTTTPNRFGAISVHMIYSLFALLSSTKEDKSIWGGPTGEKFLSEFLRTLSTMLYCAYTYPSSGLRVLAKDMFNLAWSFHDAKCAEVRHAALLGMATCMSLLPTEIVIQNAHGVGLFLNQCRVHDENPDCRYLASLVLSSMAEAMNEHSKLDS
mmetsp:Transcript_4269/g.10870  ORF Transcript_4269/g.10870 Transcript_4269/m.10870 type:complete len:1189 (-) Transcript_4269:56-3622(-)